MPAEDSCCLRLLPFPLLARHVFAVDDCKLVKDDAIGPGIGYDVMHHHHQQVFFRR